MLVHCVAGVVSCLVKPELVRLKQRLLLRVIAVSLGRVGALEGEVGGSQVVALLVDNMFIRDVDLSPDCGHGREDLLVVPEV